jgi:hypothetical protein
VNKLLLVSILAALGATSVGALWAATAAPKAPPEMTRTIVDFAAALAAGDGKAAAELASFPLDNLVFKAPKTLSKSAFLKNFTAQKDIAACLVKTPPEQQLKNNKSVANSWSIDCNGNIYYFGLRNGRWLYTGYENINE